MNVFRTSLLIYNYLHFTLFVGIASFVNAVKEGDHLKVCAGEIGYTRLSTFKSWVESQIGQDYCS